MKPLKLTEQMLPALRFPFLATPKIDGIRCTKVNGFALTASHKPIPNHYIRELIENSNVPDNFDGELIVPGNFQDVTHAVMSQDGTPPFIWRVFDYVSDAPYSARVNELALWFKSHKCGFIDSVLPDFVQDQCELEEYENTSLELGYEGICFRAPSSLYKNGRSTLNEQGLLALKRFKDSEARILGFEERMHNSNEPFQDELGRQKRSSAIEGQFGLGTLGAFIVQDIYTQVTFKIGTGFNSALAQQIWDDQLKYRGILIKYKYFPHGEKNKPRHPVFLGFRNEKDL